MTDLMKVEGHPDIVRDVCSKAIINTNKDALSKVKLEREKRIKEKQRIDNLENDVKEIKSSLNEILQLLKR